MTLRLSDEQTQLLRARAEFEGRSMQEVVKSAVEEYLESHIRADLITRILDEELPRYAEAMRRLAE
jgi:predicted DNA-binding protein